MTLRNLGSRSDGELVTKFWPHPSLPSQSERLSIHVCALHGLARSVDARGIVLCRETEGEYRATGQDVAQEMEGN